MIKEAYFVINNCSKQHYSSYKALGKSS